MNAQQSSAPGTLEQIPGIRPTRAPERFTPLFNGAFLKIFGSSDSASVTQPMLAEQIPDIRSKMAIL